MNKTFITPENKLILINRIKSLAWRAGIFAALLGLNFLSDNLGLFDLSPTTIAFISYVIGEITKWLNTRK